MDLIDVRFSFTLIGVSCVVLHGFRLLRWAWHIYIRPSTSFSRFKGDWAVVTGASRGLGRSLALALARRGLNVVLIARSRETLSDVQCSCESYGVSTVVIEADLSIESTLVDVAAALKALPGDISVLVNNVGGRPPASLPSAPIPCFAECNDGVNHDSYFKFNVLPAASLTHSLIEGMVERDKGYVLNVASFNGLAPCPLLACYSACKAYIVAWSAATDVELKGRGSTVKVDVVCPGPVATDGIGMAGRGTRRIADPDAFAEQTLSLATTRHVRVPWPAHWWNMEMYSSQSHFVPEFLSEKWLWKAIMPSW